jgi:hypothetical protein
VNADGTSTATSAVAGTSQPLNIAASNSLAAPLNVATIELTYPRNGTVLSQGDDIYGAAVLAGTGSGTVTGEWVWDGNPIEQFSVPMSGGTSVRLKTTRPLPSTYLGPHTLAVRVNSPNQVQTRSVDLVINPGNWKLEKLLAPPSDAGFTANSLPLLQWALIPGADHYQVGFATQPFYNSVEHWHDTTATEWRVPEKIWQEWPEGQLYWTVRVVDISGDTRRPAPMRSLWKLPATTALQPLAATPDATGISLSWQPLQGKVLYRVSITRNQAGTEVVKQFLTRSAKFYVRSNRLGLRAGQTYFWQVEALSGAGYSIVKSPVQSFVAPSPSPPSARARSVPYQVATAGALPGPPDLGSQISTRFPEPQATIRDSQPNIKIEFKTKINPADVSLTIDATDVTSLAQIADTTVMVSLPVAVGNGAHQVTIQVGSDSDSWSFTVAAEESGVGEAGQSAQKSDAEVPPPPQEPVLGQPTSTDAAPNSGEPPASPTGESAGIPPGQPGLQELSGQLAANTQWISGSTPDTNVVSAASRLIFHNGPWTSEVNGSGLLNSILNPDPQHALSRINDYVLRLAYERGHWNTGLRFGLLASSLYTGSEFVTTGSAREGIETWLGTPGGKLSFFSNTNDGSLGGGIGTAFHQEIRGASYDAPIPKKIADLRLMWLSARDTGGPTTISFTPTGTPPPVPPPLPGFPIPPPPTSSFLANPSAGDAYGLLLLLHLGPTWTWNTEYSLTYNNPDLTLIGGRLFGRAWKSGVSGSWKKATISFAFRDVSPNFGSPANPSLTPSSNPDRRGIDAAVSRPFKIGTFTATYQFLQSGVHSSTAPALSLNNLTLGWSQNLTPATVLQIGGRDVLTSTGHLPPAVLALTPDQQIALEADSRDAGLNASISHHIGKVTLTTGGTRDWLRNNLLPQQNVITSGVNAGANWQATIFQINSNASVNWVAADKFTVGGTRTITFYIQPTMIWKRTGLSLAPLFTVSNNKTLLNTGTLTADNFTSQYSGRMTWQMPRRLKFSTLSLEGGQVHLNDAILSNSRTDTRLLLLWTTVWGYNRPGTAGK